MRLAIGRGALISAYFEANPDRSISWEVFHDYMKYAYAYMSDELSCHNKWEPFYTFLPRKYADDSNRESRKAMAYQNLLNFASNNIKFECYKDKIQLAEPLINGFKRSSAITEPAALDELVECARIFTLAQDAGVRDDVMRIAGLYPVTNRDQSRFDSALDESNISFAKHPGLLGFPGAEYYKESHDEDPEYESRSRMYERAAIYRNELNDVVMEKYFEDPMHTPIVGLTASNLSQ